MQENFTKEVNTKSKAILTIYETLESIVMAIVLVLLIFVFFAKLSVVDGDSMFPTLHDKEYLIVSDPFFSYEPENGDIVVIQTTSTNEEKNEVSPLTIVKRVIATEGQTVILKYKNYTPAFDVYVDGELVEEDYAYYLWRPLPSYENALIEYQVPKGCIFVLGDNRNVSYDSRYETLGHDGFITKNEVVGKVIFRLLPLQKIGAVK